MIWHYPVQDKQNQNVDLMLLNPNQKSKLGQYPECRGGWEIGAAESWPICVADSDQTSVGFGLPTLLLSVH